MDIAKSSINVRPIKQGSEAHNSRSHDMEHVDSARTVNNESWIGDKVAERRAVIYARCKEISGRKMQINATPIREAVVNLSPEHHLDDLHRLRKTLKSKFNIDVFQAYLHRDEGHTNKETGEFKINHHAHLIIDWQDKNTGKMLHLGKLDMVRMQTVVADSLGLERGKEGSKAIRLEAQAYKATKESEAQEEKTEALRQEAAKLEQGNEQKRAELEKTGAEVVVLEQGNEQKREEREKIGAEVAALERKKQRLLQLLLRRCEKKWQIWKNRLKAPEKLTELFNTTMANLVRDMEKEKQSEIGKRQKDIDQAEIDYQKETPRKTPAGWFKRTFRRREVAREGVMIAERDQAHQAEQRARQSAIEALTKHHIPQKLINDRMKEHEPALYQAQEQIDRDNKIAEREQVQARRRSQGKSKDTGQWKTWDFEIGD